MLAGTSHKEELIAIPFGNGKMKQAFTNSINSKRIISEKNIKNMPELTFTWRADY